MIAAAVLALVVLACAGPPSPATWRRVTLSLGRGVSGIELLGGGEAGPPGSLVVLRPVGFDVVPLAAQGAPAGGAPAQDVSAGVAPSGGLRVMRGLDRTLAVCVAREKDGSQRLWFVRGGGAVFVTDGSTKPREVFHDEGVSLPEGTYAFDFARDLDGDGRVDLLLPERGGLRVIRGTAEGWRKGPRIPETFREEVGLPAPGDLPFEISQHVTIPSFERLDLNGDGRPDLLFRDEDRVQAFWTTPQGDLAGTPSFELDLAALREALPPVSRGTIDPANLFGMLESSVQERVLDLDGDGIADLLLRQGSKVSVYRGTPEGIDRGRAAQVLRSSGNLLAVTTLDDDGDGRDDLALLRVSDVSLADILRWVVLGGSFTLDLTVYRQEEPLRFARSPTHRRRLTLSFPSLLSLDDENVKDPAAGARDPGMLPVTADLDGDGRQDDVAWLRGAEGIEVFLDAGVMEEEGGPGDSGEPPRRKSFRERMWHDLLARFDERAGEGGELEISISELEDFAPEASRELLERLGGRQPDARLSLPAEMGSLLEQKPSHGPAGGRFSLSLGAGPRGEGTSGVQGAGAPPVLLAVADVDGDRIGDLLLVRIPGGDGSKAEGCEVVVWRSGGRRRDGEG